MKTRSIVLALTGISIAVGAAAVDSYTKRHTKKDGTYVQGHYKTQPNDTRIDNYSSKGNVNPYTGTKGTKDPYKSR